MTTAPALKFASDQIKEALVEARGSFSHAAIYLQGKWSIPCSRHYVKDAVESRTELVAFYNDLREGFIDRAEQNIFDAVIAGDIRISLTVAQTLGKNRGWSQKQEVEFVDPEQSLARITEARNRAKELRKERDALGDNAASEQGPTADG